LRRVWARGLESPLARHQYQRVAEVVLTSRRLSSWSSFSILPSCPDLHFNVPSDQDRVGVLPISQDKPSESAESFVRLTIASYIGIQFRPPPIGVGLWTARVLRACVPVAAVNKDDNSEAAPNDIAAYAGTWFELAVDPIAEATRV